jgi:hypothetical protein
MEEHLSLIGGNAGLANLASPELGTALPSLFFSSSIAKLSSTGCFKKNTHFGFWNFSVSETHKEGIFLF